MPDSLHTNLFSFEASHDVHDSPCCTLYSSDHSFCSESISASKTYSTVPATMPQPQWPSAPHTAHISWDYILQEYVTRKPFYGSKCEQWEIHSCPNPSNMYLYSLGQKRKQLHASVHPKITCLQPGTDHTHARIHALHVCD